MGGRDVETTALLRNALIRWSNSVWIWLSCDKREAFTYRFSQLERWLLEDRKRKEVTSTFSLSEQSNHHSPRCGVASLSRIVELSQIKARVGREPGLDCAAFLLPCSFFTGSPQAPPQGHVSACTGESLLSQQMLWFPRSF